MRQFVTIALNAFMELVRQPVFLLLMTSSCVFSVFLSVVPYFGLGDDPKMVKDSVLAVVLLSGLFGAVTSASASVAREIRTGTALAVLAKPVGRATFLLAKYAGLAGAITLLTYVNMIGALLAGRMAFDAYGDADLASGGIFAGALVLAYAAAGFANYFLRRPFVPAAVINTVLLLTVALVIIEFFTVTYKPFGERAHVDWRMLRAGVLILFALLIIAGIALACSTRLEMIPTLAVCTGVFLLGLMSDYLFGRPAEDGAWWASVVYAAVPNWQLFWMADALEPGKTIPAGYMGKALAYVAGYLGASLALALILFEDRELS
jgi:ABC-2 type transport system permease protein